MESVRPQRRRTGQRAIRRRTTFQAQPSRQTLPVYVPKEAAEMYKRGLEHGILLASGTQTPQANPEVERTFRALAEEWLDETAHLSDPVDKFMHPAIVQIIGMGKQVVPLLLKEVRKMSGHWFYALEHINRTNPVLPEDQWSVEQTAAAWLAWGRRERLI